MSKLINATELREGSAVIIEKVPCIVKSIDISKTGKHGHAKCRIEAVGIIDDKKRVSAVPGHERFEIPMIEKKRGQVLTILPDKSKASVMDVESFENFDVAVSSEIRENIKEGSQVEYWNIEGEKIIKRILG